MGLADSLGGLVGSVPWLLRAHGWLSEERKLIELHEWTPPSFRRAQVYTDVLSFDEFARDWIANRLVRGRPLKDRTREHYLDIHERWFHSAARTPTGVHHAGGH